MSRMTKFLKQTCQFESAQRNNDGTTRLNAYGDVLYNKQKTLRCRRERCVQDVQTNTGAIVKTSSRYFLDEQYEIQADDRVDGHTILKCDESTNALGKCEGYECYV